MELYDRRRTFHLLNLLRGLAAIIVVTRHAPAFFGIALFHGSGLAVDLFFVMSGFVIAHAYDERLRGGMRFRLFALLRFIRLYPLYVLGTLIGAVVALASIVTQVKSSQTGFVWNVENLSASLAPGLLMLPALPVGFPEGSLYPLNAVAWSLFFELLINFLHAIFLPFLSRRVLIAVMVAGGLGLIASGAFFGDFDTGWNWHNLVGGFARVFYSYTAGVLIHGLWMERRFEWRVPSWLPVVLVILLMAIRVPDNFRLGFDFLVLIVGFPLIIFWSVCTELPRRWFGVATLLGTTSYAIYALHRPMLSLTNGILQVAKINTAQYAPWIGIPFIAIFVVLCWFIDKIYDQPVRNFLVRRLTK